jgi:hypothetical protein
VLGFIILFLLQPVNFNTTIVKRLNDEGINFQVEDRVTKCSDHSAITSSLRSGYHGHYFICIASLHLHMVCL